MRKNLHIFSSSVAVPRIQDFESIHDIPIRKSVCLLTNLVVNIFNVFLLGYWRVWLKGAWAISITLEDLLSDLNHESIKQVMRKIRQKQYRTEEERRNVPAEIGKVVVIFQGCNFGQEAEIPEIFCKELWKSQLSIEIFMKSPNFLLFFNFFIFGQNAESFARRVLNYPCLTEIIDELLTIMNSSTNDSRLSPILSKISILFQYFFMI